MPEDITKRLAVTFSTGKPLGVHAHFKHEGAHWIAYPATKNTRIFAVIDRMVGIFGRIHDDMTRWINDWPNDAERVVGVLESVNRARNLQRELINEKTEAATQ